MIPSENKIKAAASAGRKYMGTVFLDRDGVVNRDSPEYIKKWSEFEFLPGSVNALSHLTQSGYTSIVITNQSVINRKMTSPKELDYIHAMMLKTVRDGGGNIADIFFCPHIPDDRCDCRKPRPGLIYQAQIKYDIDLASAFMIGDSAKDIECARNAGCGHAILVKTGNAAQAQKILLKKKIRPDCIADDLNQAVNWIILHDKKHSPPAEHT